MAIAPMIGASRLGLVGVALTLFTPAPAAASTVNVAGGVLSLATGPTEPVRIGLGFGLAEAGQPGDVRVGQGAFDGQYLPGHRKWPGGMPTGGAGCAPDRYGSPVCSGVQAIDVAFGDGDDAGTVFGNLSPLPVRLSGGAGHDGLESARTPAVTLDGGPGEDFIRLDQGTAIGGDGDDVIRILESTGRVQIDCGPGNDAIRQNPTSLRNDPRKTGRIAADPASCPPVITPLVALNAFYPGPQTVFYVPTDGRFRVPFFKASEAVKGTAWLRRPDGHDCAPPVHFSATAGQPIRPLFRLKPWLAHQVARLPASRARACTLGFAGTDAQHERFTSDSNPDYPTDSDDVFVVVKFVSHRATNGRNSAPKTR